MPRPARQRSSASRQSSTERRPEDLVNLPERGDININNEGQGNSESDSSRARDRHHPYRDVSWNMDNPGNWTVAELKDRLWEDCGIKVPRGSISKVTLKSWYVENMGSTSSPRTNTVTSVTQATLATPPVPTTTPHINAPGSSSGSDTNNMAALLSTLNNVTQCFSSLQDTVRQLTAEKGEKRQNFNLGNWYVSNRAETMVSPQESQVFSPHPTANSPGSGIRSDSITAVDIVSPSLQRQITEAFPHAGGTTPLHLAAANNHIDCVTKLIWDGADYNAVDEFGRTSLYIAAQKTFEDCVHAHLNNAIWKDILSLPSKQTGDTPLHECVKNGMLSCVESLLKRGSDVNHKNMAGFSPLHLVVQANKTFSMDMLRQLVMNGYNTDVNIPESLGYSPLHYVCFHETSMQERRPEAAALLIAYGASYKILNRQGDNVLQYELRNKNTDRTILHAIVKSEAYLPTLESLGAVSAHILPPDARDPRHQGIMNLNRSDEQYAKLSWYRDLCKDPRPLQHYCRCVIRNTVGVRRLSKIDTLPLPTTLKEYLHLTLEEFRS